MSTHWQLCTDAEQAASLQTLEQVFALTGKSVSQDLKSTVIFSRLGEKNVYIKRYTKGGKFWRRYLGRSRVRAEWENLQLFAAWGIDTPPLLAYGEEYCFGHFERGALVTEEVPRAQSLAQLAEQQHPLLSDPALFRHLVEVIARYTGMLHQHHFTHNDLDWRNILVVPTTQKDRPPRVLFFDCPGGRFWWTLFLKHRITKDLAHLDKLAREHLSLRQRLQFYHQYTGRKKLNAADKKQLRQIAGYFDDARYRHRVRL